ncbi:MAG: hypothetical protein RLZZ453_872 [Chlamydiota bacterium]|jgi:hypothetical protein
MSVRPPIPSLSTDHPRSTDPFLPKTTATTPDIPLRLSNLLEPLLVSPTHSTNPSEHTPPYGEEKYQTTSASKKTKSRCQTSDLDEWITTRLHLRPLGIELLEQLLSVTGGYTSTTSNVAPACYNAVQQLYLRSSQQNQSDPMESCSHPLPFFFDKSGQLVTTVRDVHAPYKEVFVRVYQERSGSHPFWNECLRGSLVGQESLVSMLSNTVCITGKDLEELYDTIYKEEALLFKEKRGTNGFSDNWLEVDRNMIEGKQQTQGGDSGCLRYSSVWGNLLLERQKRRTETLNAFWKNKVNQWKQSLLAMQSNETKLMTPGLFGKNAANHLLLRWEKKEDNTYSLYVYSACREARTEVVAAHPRPRNTIPIFHFSGITGDQLGSTSLFTLLEEILKDPENIDAMSQDDIGELFKNMALGKPEATENISLPVGKGAPLYWDIFKPLVFHVVGQDSYSTVMNAVYDRWFASAEELFLDQDKMKGVDSNTKDRLAQLLRSIKLAGRNQQHYDRACTATSNGQVRTPYEWCPTDKKMELPRILLKDSPLPPVTSEKAPLEPLDLYIGYQGCTDVQQLFDTHLEEVLKVALSHRGANGVEIVSQQISHFLAQFPAETRAYAAALCNGSLEKNQQRLLRLAEIAEALYNASPHAVLPRERNALLTLFNIIWLFSSQVHRQLQGCSAETSHHFLPLPYCPAANADDPFEIFSDPKDLQRRQKLRQWAENLGFTNDTTPQDPRDTSGKGWNFSEIEGCYKKDNQLRFIGSGLTESSSAVYLLNNLFHVQSPLNVKAQQPVFLDQQVRELIRGYDSYGNLGTSSRSSPLSSTQFISQFQSEESLQCVKWGALFLLAYPGNEYYAQGTATTTQGNPIVHLVVLKTIQLFLDLTTLSLNQGYASSSRPWVSEPNRSGESTLRIAPTVEKSSTSLRDDSWKLSPCFSDRLQRKIIRPNSSIRLQAGHLERGATPSLSGSTWQAKGTDDQQGVFSSRYDSVQHPPNEESPATQKFIEEEKELYEGLDRFRGGRGEGRTLEAALVIDNMIGDARQLLKPHRQTQLRLLLLGSLTTVDSVTGNRTGFTEQQQSSFWHMVQEDSQGSKKKLMQLLEVTRDQYLKAAVPSIEPTLLAIELVQKAAAVGDPSEWEDAINLAHQIVEEAIDLAERINYSPGVLCNLYAYRIEMMRFKEWDKETLKRSIIGIKQCCSQLTQDNPWYLLELMQRATDFYHLHRDSLGINEEFVKSYLDAVHLSLSDSDTIEPVYEKKLYKIVRDSRIFYFNTVTLKVERGGLLGNCQGYVFPKEKRASLAYQQLFGDAVITFTQTSKDRIDVEHPSLGKLRIQNTSSEFNPECIERLIQGKWYRFAPQHLDSTKNAFKNREGLLHECSHWVREETKGSCNWFLYVCDGTTHCPLWLFKKINSTQYFWTAVDKNGFPLEKNTMRSEPDDRDFANQLELRSGYIQRIYQDDKLVAIMLPRYGLTWEKKEQGPWQIRGENNTTLATHHTPSILGRFVNHYVCIETGGNLGILVPPLRIGENCSHPMDRSVSFKDPLYPDEYKKDQTDFPHQWNYDLDQIDKARPDFIKRKNTRQLYKYTCTPSSARVGGYRLEAQTPEAYLYLTYLFLLQKEYTEALFYLKKIEPSWDYGAEAIQLSCAIVELTAKTADMTPSALAIYVHVFGRLEEALNRPGVFISKRLGEEATIEEKTTLEKGQRALKERIDRLRESGRHKEETDIGPAWSLFKILTHYKQGVKHVPKVLRFDDAQATSPPYYAQHLEEWYASEVARRVEQFKDAKNKRDNWYKAEVKKLAQFRGGVKEQVDLWSVMDSKAVKTASTVYEEYQQKKQGLVFVGLGHLAKEEDPFPLCLITPSQPETEAQIDVACWFLLHIVLKFPHPNDGYRTSQHRFYDDTPQEKFLQTIYYRLDSRKWTPWHLQQAMQTLQREPVDSTKKQEDRTKLYLFSNRKDYPFLFLLLNHMYEQEKIDVKWESLEIPKDGEIRDYDGKRFKTQCTQHHQLFRGLLRSYIQKTKADSTMPSQKPVKPPIVPPCKLNALKPLDPLLEPSWDEWHNLHVKTSISAVQQDAVSWDAKIEDPIYKEAITDALKSFEEDFNAGCKANREKSNHALNDVSSLKEKIQTAKEALSEIVKKQEEALLHVVHPDKASGMDPYYVAQHFISGKQYTVTDLAYLFLAKDSKRLEQLFPFLEPQAIQALEAQIEQHLRHTCWLHRLARIEKALSGYQKASEEEKTAFAQQVGEELAFIQQGRSKLGRAHLVFEALSGMSYRPKQGKILERILTDEGDFNETVFQMMMGGGKTTVIASTLSHIAAKGTEKPQRLVIFMPYGPQESSLRSSLTTSQRKNWDQTVHRVPFTLKSLDLRLLTWIESTMDRCSQERGVLLLLPEQVHILRHKLCLLAIEGQEREEFQVLKRILNKIKEARVIIDECDSTLKIEQEVNVPIGEATPLSQDSIEIMQELFIQCIGHPDFNPYFSAGCVITTSFYEKVLQPQMAQFFADKMGLPHLKGALEKYFSGEITEADEKALLLQLDDLADSKHQNRIALTRYILQDILPSALTKEANRHFGRRVQDPRIVPYVGAGCPGTTQYANPYEAAVFHYLNALKYGITEEQFDLWIEHLAQEDKCEHEESEGLSGSTQAARKCKELTGQKLALLAHPDRRRLSIADARKNALEYIKNNPLSRLSIEAHTVGKYVTFYPEQLRSNAHHLIDLLGPVVAMSGTPWNVTHYARINKEMMLDSGVEGSIADKLIKDDTPIHVVKTDGADEILRSILERHPKKDLVTGIIDAAGLFKNYTTLDVVKQISRYYDFSKDVLFFHRFEGDIDESPAVLKKDGTVVRLKDTTLDTLKAAGLDLKYLFNFYDEQRATGTDIPNLSDAVLLVTASHNTLKRTLFQAVMRARGFFQKQRVEFVVHESTREHLINNGSSVKDLITSTVIAEARQLGEGEVRALRAALETAKTRQTFNQLLDSGKVGDMVPFITTLHDTPYKLFKEIPRDRNTKEVLIEEIKAAAQLSLEEQEVLIAAVNVNPCLPAMIRGTEGGIALGTEVQVQVQVQTNTKTDTKTDQSIEDPGLADIEAEWKALQKPGDKAELEQPTPEQWLAWIERISQGAEVTGPLFQSERHKTPDSVVSLQEVLGEKYAKALPVDDLFATSGWHRYEGCTVSVFHKYHHLVHAMLVIRAPERFVTVFVSKGQADVLNTLFKRQPVEGAQLVSSYTGKVIGWGEDHLSPIGRQVNTACVVAQLISGNFAWLEQHPKHLEAFAYFLPEDEHDLFQRLAKLVGCRFRLNQNGKPQSSQQAQQDAMRRRPWLMALKQGTPKTLEEVTISETRKRKELQAALEALHRDHKQKIAEISVCLAINPEEEKERRGLERRCEMMRQVLMATHQGMKDALEGIV